MTMQGKSLEKFRGTIIKEMKLMFKSSQQKSLLTSGQIVLQLCCECLCLVCSEALVENPEYFLHIGHMSLSPYKPTYHKLQRLHSEKGADVAIAFIDLQDISWDNMRDCTR